MVAARREELIFPSAKGMFDSQFCLCVKRPCSQYPGISES
jgi:hypothetical protein